MYAGFKKYSAIDAEFHEGIREILNLDIPKIDFIHQFPVFVGSVNLARYLSLYDLYKQCYTLSGHIADIGTWKGSSFLFMAKIVRLFEPNSLTQVHGFDWFKGMSPSEENNDCMKNKGEYTSDYDLLIKLIALQKMNDTAIVHKLDLCKDLGAFFHENNHMRFKMIFVDCGVKEVLENSLTQFWPRLCNGGVLIMDHYNTEDSPFESQIIENAVGKNLIQHFPYNRSPTAYIVKEC